MEITTIKEKIEQPTKLSKNKKILIILAIIIPSLLLLGIGLVYLIIYINGANETLGPDGRARYYYTQTIGDNSATLNLTLPRDLYPDTTSAPEGKGYLIFDFGVSVSGEYLLDINNFELLSTPNIEVDKDKTIELNSFLGTDETFTLTDEWKSFHIAFLVDEDFWDGDQDNSLILQADFAYFVCEQNIEE